MRAQLSMGGASPAQVTNAEAAASKTGSASEANASCFKKGKLGALVGHGLPASEPIPLLRHLPLYASKTVLCNPVNVWEAFASTRPKLANRALRSSSRLPYVDGKQPSHEA